MRVSPCIGLVRDMGIEIDILAEYLKTFAHIETNNLFMVCEESILSVGVSASLERGDSSDAPHEITSKSAISSEKWVATGASGTTSRSTESVFLWGRRTTQPQHNSGGVHLCAGRPLLSESSAVVQGGGL